MGSDVGVEGGDSDAGVEGGDSDVGVEDVGIQGPGTDGQVPEF